MMTHRAENKLARNGHHHAYSETVILLNVEDTFEL